MNAPLRTTIATFALSAAACFGSSSSAPSATSTMEAGAGDDAATSSPAPADATVTPAPSDAEAGPAPVDAGIDSGADGGACVDPSDWPTVTPTVDDASEPPAQTGGALQSGRYYLTAMSYFQAPCAQDETLSVMITLAVDASGASGTETELSLATAGKSSAGGCITGTFTANGSTLVKTNPHSTITEEYSVTLTGFTVVDGDYADAGDCEPTVMTFTRQP